jgi:4-amino-4-deoxy-L-arabinose transferase-like glycosyltransferase
MSSYAWRPVGVVAGLLLAGLLALAGRYGYHRDELYFLAAGRRLAWGYDDQPPLTVVVARLMDELAPGSLVVLRTPSALLAAASVLLVAAIARELGGDRRAQLIAAIATAVAPIVVFTGHLLSTTTVDFTLGALLGWLFARWIRTRRDRLLVLAGVVTGFALLNKATFAVLVAMLLVSVLVTGPRELFRRPALWAGAAIALAAWMPYLLWQADNGWPQLDMADAIRADEPGGGRILLLPMQVALLGPPIVAVAVAGAVRLLRNPQARPFRSLGLAYLLLLAVYLVLGGQFYYPTGGAPALIAAGAVATAGWLAGEPRRRVAWWAAAGLTAVTTIGLGLPVYPAAALASTPQPAVFPDSAETVGWPGFVETVASVYATLPEPERGTAVVFTTNYGEAGAIERYGPAYGLPAPYSGHNAYWRWGPPPDAATGPAIVVGEVGTGGFGCGSATLAATHDNGLDLDNEEQGARIWVCRDRAASWSQLWPSLRRLS